jgi:hypothetical protein
VGRFADRATAAAARSLTWRGRMGAGRCGKLERPNPKSGISHGQIGSPGMASPWTVLDNLVALEIAGAAVASAWIFTEAWIYLGLLRPNLERDLGFHESTATLPSSGLRGYISAVAVVSVSEDGRFARAGIRAGDVLPDESHTSLFKKLHRHRGRMVELAIVDGGAGSAFHERPRRVIRLDVPPRRS